MKSRDVAVRAFFDRPEHYLRTDFNVRIRAEIVQAFIGRQAVGSILDIGCGTGAISIPLLAQTASLTLLDRSSSMLAIATSRIPRGYEENVEVVHADFFRADLPRNSFDLILCFGVIAHVDSPYNLVAKMAELLKPHGSIVVQNSDAHHPIDHLNHAIHGVLHKAYPALRRHKYALNDVSDRDLVSMFRDHDLTKTAIYRYNLPPPGVARVLTSDQICALTRVLYGTPAMNYGAWLGSECIYQFGRSSAASPGPPASAD
jgi:ubiquinone/menaquinone biosynthesis C-methylase UbiE